MNALTALGSAGHVPSLADELVEVASIARRAATFADGEYLPQMARDAELRTSMFDAGRAADALEDLKVRIAMLDGGEDGLKLAQRALNQLGEGTAALQGHGFVVEDDLVRGGAAVVDVISTGAAGAMFREAESKVRGIADIARIEGMSPDDVLRGLLAGGSETAV